jgi:class 3 adenylate cyclase/TolB-like protein
MPASSRRLAAILFADIAGYTALMQHDEQAALEKLARFKETLEAKTADFQGQIIQYYGDGCLVIFDSPVAAVACAEALQMSFQSDKVPVRIGIHLGDVVFKEDNVFGDAVNIASRIESLGVAGAVLLSQTVRRQIKNHPEFQLAPLGSFEFKNVDEPLEVFALANEGFPVPKRAEMEGKLKAAGSQTTGWKKWAWAAGILILAVAGFVFLKKTARASEKSIAVLPFKNLSGNPENQYFCDGMMDDILSRLFKIGTLRVISRTSMEAYRQTDKSLPVIASELKVSHLLEGSVQRSGDSIKIILQLIHADDDRHVWSEEFTRAIEDVFALQSEIAKIVAKELNATISAAESRRINKAPASNLEAYDALLNAQFACLQYMYNWKEGEDDYRHIISLCDKALALDPSLGKVYVIKAWAYKRSTERYEYWEERFLDSVYILARQALAIDEELADAQALMGDYYSSQSKMDSAVFHLEKALEIEPNNFYALYILGALHAQSAFDKINGWTLDSPTIEKGISMLLRAGELDPLSPMMLGVHNKLADAYGTIGDFETEAFYAKKMIENSKTETEILYGYHKLFYSYLFRGIIDTALLYTQKIADRTKPGCYFVEAETHARFEGDWQKGAAQLECALKEDPDMFKGRQSLAYAYWKLGKKKEAKKLFDEFLAQCEKVSKLNGDGEYYDVAAVYAVLGDKEKAYENLRKLDETGWLWALPWYIQYDHMFENLWQDEEFKKMVQRVTDQRARIRERLRAKELKG